MLVKAIYFATLSISFFFFIWFQYFNYIFYLSNTDDAIYSQALHLITWSNLNPYIPFRQVHIFNDHFDIILIPIALTFAKIFPPLLVGYALEILCLVASTGILYWMYRKEDISFSTLTVATLLLLMSGSTFMAILFPFHPTTWSVFPLTLLGYFLFKDNTQGILFSYIFLLLFKEVYIVVGGMLIILSVFEKKHQRAIILFILTFIWYFLAFKLRYIRGYESIRYDEMGHAISLDGVGMMFHDFFYGRKVLQNNFFIFFPVIALWFYAWKKKLKPQWTPLLLLLPLWLVNFKMGEGFFNVHRVVAFSPLLAMFVAYTFKRTDISTKIVVSLFLFLMFTNYEAFVKYIHVNQKGVREVPSWEQRWERKKAIDEAVLWISEHPQDNVFTSSNMASHLTKNEYVLGYGGLFGKDEEKISNVEGLNYYLFDRVRSDEVAQYTPSGNTTEIIDNEYVLLIKLPKK